MTNTLAQSDSENSLLEAAVPESSSINPKFIVATPGIHSKEINVDLGGLLRRLSDLVDGFSRLSRVGRLPFEKPESPDHWNLLQCADAILPIVSAHGGNQFQRSPDSSPICYHKSSHQAALFGPCSMCVGDRSSLFTKSSCSEAGTC